VDPGVYHLFAAFDRRRRDVVRNLGGSPVDQQRCLAVPGNHRGLDRGDGAVDIDHRSLNAGHDRQFAVFIDGDCGVGGIAIDVRRQTRDQGAQRFPVDQHLAG
jgi:hypothetical protein